MPSPTTQLITINGPEVLAKLRGVDTFSSDELDRASSYPRLSSWHIRKDAGQRSDNRKAKCKHRSRKEERKLRRRIRRWGKSTQKREEISEMLQIHAPLVWIREGCVRRLTRSFKASAQSITYSSARWTGSEILNLDV